MFTAERTWDSYDLLGFLKALPWSKAPRVVVLDNASLHTSKVIRGPGGGLAASGIYLYFLPPYSPELNRDRAGVPAGQASGDPGAELHDPGRASRGRRDSASPTTPGSSDQEFKKNYVQLLSSTCALFRSLIIWKSLEIPVIATFGTPGIPRV